jgi:hypothetical protein
MRYRYWTDPKTQDMFEIEPSPDKIVIFKNGVEVKRFTEPITDKSVRDFIAELQERT